MFFEGKSSQKHLGNIYKFFEKRNSFARVTTWQSSNIGCFLLPNFRNCRLPPEEVEILHNRMKEAGVQNMSAYIRKMALNGYVIIPKWLDLD